MFIRFVCCLSVVLAGVTCAGAAIAQNSDTQLQPALAIEDLGNQRYRVGEIVIDKSAGSFKVPGQVLRDEPPLEFLVVTKDGAKSYESLLEVNADAYQFNLACILIGLDASHAEPIDQRVLEQPVKGDPVEITVSWLQNGKSVRAGGSDLLLEGVPPAVVASRKWVYTGSRELPDGRYLADLAGSLLGFVHRGESIIEHQQGLGIGNYGAILVNRDVVPRVGTAIELQVRRINANK